MTILRDLSLYWTMIHVVILFLLFFRSKYTPKKTIALAGILMVVLMVINAIGLALVGITVMGNMIFFTCSLPSFLFFYVLSEDKSFRYLFSFCLADTVGLWILAATNLLDYYFGGSQYVLMFMSRLVVFPLLEIFAYKYLRKPYMELQEAVKEGWGVFAGMTVLYYLLLLVMFNYPVTVVQRPDDVLGFVLTLIAMVFVYAVMYTAMRKQYLIYQQQHEEEMLRGQKHALELQLENQQHIRRMKHDMRGHTVTLLGLLSSGKDKEAMEYLKKMENDIDAFQGQVCANPYLNAVFSYYLQKFDELHTKLRLDIKIGNREIPYMELCSILTNGLDNAFEASRELKPELRSVSVQMKYSKDYLIIRIRNRCKDYLAVKRGELPKTAKMGKGHGHGLLSIKEMAEKLGGDMICYTEQDSFVLDVMIRTST